MHFMQLITMKRILKLGIVNFWRNRWLSLAASLMIMLTLVTMGIFALLNIFASTTAEGIKERIDLSIYYYENATDAQIKEMQFTLANRSDVKSVRYISKDEAFEEWQRRTLNEKVKSLITREENPLPRSLQVKANNAEDLEAIANAVSVDTYKPIVREVSYQKTKGTIDRLIRLTQLIRRMGWALTVFLLMVSLIVVLNTMRLAIFTRRDEVEIMRLVGANGAFIRIPFSVEAILYGIAGAILSYLIVTFIMTYFGPRLAGYFSDVANSSTNSYFYLIRPYFETGTVGQSTNWLSSALHLWQLGLMQLAVGILFSVSCSMLALRRYLRV